MTSLTRLAAALATLLIVALIASPASAHVLLDSAQPNGDGSVTLTFSFDHGCRSSPTTSLRTTLPDGAEIVSVGQPDGWTGSTDSGVVSWSGPGIPPGDQATFTITARLQGTVGAPVLFPTQQRCENGDGYDWTQTDESGERPAPRLIATAAVLAPGPTASAAASGPGTEVTVAVVAGFAVAAGAVARAVLRRRPPLR